MANVMTKECYCFKYVPDQETFKLQFQCRDGEKAHFYPMCEVLKLGKFAKQYCSYSDVKVSFFLYF